MTMILFASECHFARSTLEKLLDLELIPAAVVLPGHNSLASPLATTPPAISLTIVGKQPSVTSTAHSAGIPVFRIGRPTPDAVGQLPGMDERPMLLSVCYPRLIPEPTVNLFFEHSLNIHPSLLPDLRGPDPMFWTFQRGTRIAGVTLHRLTPEFDAGPIVARQQVDWVDGETEQGLELRLTVVAGELLSSFLASPTLGIEQNHEDATWAPMPDESDFRIGPDWPAQRVFDFVRGVEGRGVPIQREPQDES